MLHACLEVGFALLAVFGLLSLGWVLFGRLLSPTQYSAPAFAVVPARGDGGALEQTVRGLLWLRAGEVMRYTVIIADMGLDADGAAIGQRLAQREFGIVFCDFSELGRVITALS